MRSTRTCRIDLLTIATVHCNEYRLQYHVPEALRAPLLPVSSIHRQLHRFNSTNRPVDWDTGLSSTKTIDIQHRKHSGVSRAPASDWFSPSLAFPAIGRTRVDAFADEKTRKRSVESASRVAAFTRMYLSNRS